MNIYLGVYVDLIYEDVNVRKIKANNRVEAIDIFKNSLKEDRLANPDSNDTLRVIPLDSIRIID